MGNNPSLYKYYSSSQFKKDSVVVITGGCSGMGRELVNRYAHRGCKVVIADRQHDRFKQIQEECYTQFGNANVLGVPCDVTDEDQTKKVIEEAVKKFGTIDLLVLAAGISAHAPFEDYKDMATFRKVVEVNLYGCVYLTRYALKYLKKENRTDKSKGHIVVFSSFSGEFGLPSRSSYCASKFAVNGFFESLRMEVGESIDITTICPVTVQTEFRQNSLIKSEQRAEDAAEGSTITVKEAVDEIIVAADHRIPKLIFPFKPWLAVQLKNAMPN